MITEWATKHGISDAAMADLHAMLGAADAGSAEALSEGSETRVQSLIRLEASRVGARLWRNNVGAGKLDNGSFLRWGLCNDSAAMNKRIKSADLIGIRKRFIRQADVGSHVGQFIAREIKHPGWVFKGTEREQAQLAFLGLVTSLGGDARFATGEGTL